MKKILLILTILLCSFSAITLAKSVDESDRINKIVDFMISEERKIVTEIMLFSEPEAQAFWPIYNEEPEMVGTTVHYLDKGIDTGAILLQRQIHFNPDDTLKTITYRQHAVGVALLLKCLSEYDKLAPQAYYKTDCPSKNYIAPGLTHYLKAKRWLKRRDHQ